MLYSPLLKPATGFGSFFRSTSSRQGTQSGCQLVSQLGATTGKDEILRSVAWRKLELPNANWNRVASRCREEEIIASTKYVDDRNNESLTACRKCVAEYSPSTYRASFSGTPARKFLDCRKHFSGKKPGARPRMSLTPILKNEVQRDRTGPYEQFGKRLGTTASHGGPPRQQVEWGGGDDVGG